MFIETPEDLEFVLGQLRRLDTDHQWAEAKRAQRGFPADLWKSVGALANTGGGLVLLGVDEATRFAVTGLTDPKTTAEQLKRVCEDAEPALRALISIIEHADGAVIAAQIPAVPRFQQPCFFPKKGSAEQSSFYRMHDGDHRFTPVEVAHLVDAHSTPDHSRRPAPDGAELNSELVDQFLAVLSADRRNDALNAFGATADGRTTLAGWLSLGHNPQGLSPLAQIACVAQPRDTDPLGAEQRGENIEGVVGELLIGVMQWMSRAIGTVQVRSEGTLVDQLDYPAGALREMVSNAIVHRSFRSADEMTKVSVTASDLIVISNPGGVHPGVDPSRLGLTPMSTPRNYTLVRLCEHIQTPDGGRILESLATGIPRADRLCREAGCIPPLFIAGPATFKAVCVRGRLDLAGAAATWPTIGDDSNKLRLIATLTRLNALTAADPNSVLGDVRLDDVLAARILGTSVLAHAAVTLNELRSAGVLVEIPGFEQPHWELASQTRPQPATSTPATVSPKRKKRTQAESIAIVLEQLNHAPDQTLARSEFNLGSGQTATSKIVRAATELGLIQSTIDDAHDPRRKYTLTNNGRRQLARRP